LYIDFRALSNDLHHALLAFTEALALPLGAKPNQGNPPRGHASAREAFLLGEKTLLAQRVDSFGSYRRSRRSEHGAQWMEVIHGGLA
jgi:hypothetical protein